MTNYKHDYNEGDIVIDNTLRHIFKFQDKIDGWLAENKPKQLRLANEKESKYLLRKDRTFIHY